jgi:hypothetical protein
MNWHIVTQDFPSGHRRRPRGRMADHTEACEQRILLSASTLGPVRSATASGGRAGTASAAASSPSKPPATSPIVVRDPSTAGPNGTTYLANDATSPPTWQQQQQANVVPPLDSLVNVTAPAMNEIAPPSGGSANPGEAGIFGSAHFAGQTVPQSQTSFATSPFSFPNQTVAATNNGLGGNSAVSNGLGEVLPLVNLDIAFMQPLDITSPTPSGWFNEPLQSPNGPVSTQFDWVD